MEKHICRLPDPYPEIICSGNNPHDVQLLQPLYAGLNSELTAILQYGYQHIVLHNSCEEVAKLLSEISIVEMHHLELLAKAICAMGGNPRYVNPSIRSWWNAGAVNYDQNLCAALLANLKGETEACNAYRNTARQVKNTSLCALLNRIAADEKLHIDLFTQMINCHCRK